MSAVQPGVKKSPPTVDDKRAAVALFDALGPKEASARSGWSQKAITGWAAKDVFRTHTHAMPDFTKEDWTEHLVGILKGVAVLAAQRELACAPLAEASIANRIRTTAVHDVQLLTGKATERTEAIEVTASEALSLADELAARRKAKDVPGTAVAG